MLDARYKDHYFDADKKQGLREMLDTVGQVGMMKSWLRLNKLPTKQHSK